MEPTYIGVIVAVIGIALLWRSPASMLALVLICTLFGGSSAVNLPALGGSSVQPAYVALAFLMLRVALLALRRHTGILWALWQNVFLAGFVFYGSATAFILPKLFAGAMDVRPNRPTVYAMYFTQPLAFTPQNITQAAYLLGTLGAAVTSAIVVKTQQCQKIVVEVAILMAWLHTGVAILDLVLNAVGMSEVFDLVRNANYAQVNQVMGEWKRIAGTYPEPSAFCQFAFVWFVFVVELWLRHIKPRQTGLAALALLAMMLLTTSTTAYLSLTLYAVTLMLRLVVFPMRLPFGRSVLLAALGLTAFAGFMATLVMAPEVADKVGYMLSSMTVNKMESESGNERAFWIQKGIEAFNVSHGLGVGIGSFRSSSILSAIAGSMGIVGLVTFFAHLWMTLKPLRPSSHRLRQPAQEAVASAVSWTAVLTVIPLFLNGANADPGLLFGVLSGMAVGWRAPQPQTGKAKPMRRVAAPAIVR